MRKIMTLALCLAAGVASLVSCGNSTKVAADSTDTASITGLDFMTGVTASIACVGNVGPGFGDIGSMSNYSSLPGFIKLSGMAEMLIGRLEIFPVLYLLSSIRMKRSRIG